MSDPAITGCPAPPSADPPLPRPKKPLPNLLAAGEAAVHRLEAVDSLSAATLGRARASLFLPTTGDTPAGSTGASPVPEIPEKAGTGNAGSLARTLGRPLLTRPDGSRMAFVVGAEGALGPSNLSKDFLALRGHLALRLDRMQPDESYRRFTAIGPAIGIDGASNLAGLAITGGGVGGHVESGVAIPLGKEKTDLELAGYADVMSNGQEGGLFLRVRTGP